MHILSDWAPSFFSDEKLIISSKRELISFRQLIKCLTYTCDVKKPEYVESYYNHKLDYTCGSQQKIHFSIEEVADDFRTHSLVKPMQMVARFNSDMYSKVPYAYTCIYDDTIFIVQNVRNGKLERASGVVLEWHMSRINLGYESHPIDIPEDIKVYEIENESIICKYADTDGPSVLKFANGFYAALLEL
jgi:hypothetical protein